MATISDEEDITIARCFIKAKTTKDQLLGLLDFYSDRATAHASLSVAVVFGIFGLLAIYKSKLRTNIPLNQAYWEYLQGYWWYFLLFFVTYAALYLGAIYLALNFGWYAEIADRVKFLLLENEGYIKAFATYRKHGSGTVDSFLNDLTQGDWRYKTSENIVRTCILSLFRAYTWLKFRKEAIYSPEKWKELQTILKTREISLKSILIYFGLVILPNLILFIKLISDWIA